MQPPHVPGAIVRPGLCAEQLLKLFQWPLVISLGPYIALLFYLSDNTGSFVALESNVLKKIKKKTFLKSSPCN